MLGLLSDRSQHVRPKTREPEFKDYEFKGNESNRVKRKFEDFEDMGEQASSKRAKSQVDAPALVLAPLDKTGIKRKADEKFVIEDPSTIKVKRARTKPIRERFLIDNKSQDLASILTKASLAESVALSQLCTLLATLSVAGQAGLVNDMVAGLAALTLATETKLESQAQATQVAKSTPLTVPEEGTTTMGIERPSIAHFEIGDIVYGAAISGGASSRQGADSDSDSAVGETVHDRYSARVVGVTKTMVTCVWLLGPQQKRGPISYPLDSFEMQRVEQEKSQRPSSPSYFC